MTSGFWAISPLLVPLSTAVLTMATAKRPALQRAVSFAGALLFLICGGVLLARTHHSNDALRLVFGGWPAPFGIEFKLDRLGALFVFITALLGFVVLLFRESDADTQHGEPKSSQRPSEGNLSGDASRSDIDTHYVLPMVHGLLAAVAASFSTGDLFNLYVWFELMLICSLGLFVVGVTPRKLDAALKYLVLNLFGTLLLLTGVALVYATTGHLNFDAIHVAVTQSSPERWMPALTLLAVAFLIKAGAFPFFSWLPASYHTLPAPILALFAGLLTKVGAYATLRMFGQVFVPTPSTLVEALGWISAATMFIGVIGAAYHWDIRRILSFHIISQIGYILLGIALATPNGTTATIFYTAHHIIVKANLFLLGAIIFRLTGHYDLRRIGGLFATRRSLAVLFAIPALSLVGVPPLSGFWAKFLVLRETLALGRYTWTAIALLVSALTLYSMLKIWLEAFFKPHPDANWTPPTDTRLKPAWVATILLSAVTVSIGLMPSHLLDIAFAAAEALVP